MKWMLTLTPVALIAACGGDTMLYRSVGQGNVEDVIACAVDSIDDEGFTVTDRNDDAGLLNATYTGADDSAEGAWIQMQVLPENGLNYAIEIETSDDDRAREAAAEIAAECGTSS